MPDINISAVSTLINTTMNATGSVSTSSSAINDTNAARWIVGLFILLALLFASAGLKLFIIETQNKERKSRRSYSKFADDIYEGLRLNTKFSNFTDGSSGQQFCDLMENIKERFKDIKATDVIAILLESGYCVKDGVSYKNTLSLEKIGVLNIKENKWQMNKEVYNKITAYLNEHSKSSIEDAVGVAPAARLKV